MNQENLPANIMDDIFATAGEGVDYDTSELQIPFVRVIQALSPQIKKNDPSFIKGASAGDCFNTVTGEYWEGDKGIEVVPCFQQTKYFEFVPRSEGGGFVGEVEINNPDISKTSRVGAAEILPNGNELVKSDQHFCLVLGKDGMFQPAIVDMKSTQLKVSRIWKSKIAMLKIKNPKGQLLRPALFATVWSLKTIEQSNDKGSWYNWSVEMVKQVDDKNLFSEARHFRDSVKSGMAKAVEEDHSANQTEEGEVPF